MADDASSSAATTTTMPDGDDDASSAPAAAAPADEAEEFEMAYLTAISNFHMVLQEGCESSESPGTRIIRHLSTLRTMAADAKGDADTQSVRREMHGACVAKAREWVERRTNDLVAEFHLRWHEDSDLLAVDMALRESVRLVSDAESELGALPVSHEVLGACEGQLRTALGKHVRRANRHELRMLYADFCGVASRAELRELCLDKYREQVDKHVQTEAVGTQMKLQALLDARDAIQAVRSGVGDGGEAGGGGASGSAGDAQHGSTVAVLSDYLEGVAGLREELEAAELPCGFVASVLREVEQEACTQSLELLSQVLSRSPPLPNISPHHRSHPQPQYHPHHHPHHHPTLLSSPLPGAHT